MNFSELFRAEDLIVGFDPVDKWEAIRVLLDHMVSAGRLAPEHLEDTLEAVLSRECSMSTGMEAGVAIPHAAVDNLDDVAACMGIVSREGGLAFESIDGQPTRLIVLLIIPRSQKLLHIKTLADVARLLSQSEVRDAILAAQSADEAHAILDRSWAAS